MKSVSILAVLVGCAPAVHLETAGVTTPAGRALVTPAVAERVEVGVISSMSARWALVVQPRWGDATGYHRAAFATGWPPESWGRDYVRKVTARVTGDPDGHARLELPADDSIDLAPILDLAMLDWSDRRISLEKLLEPAFSAACPRAKSRAEHEGMYLRWDAARDRLIILLYRRADGVEIIPSTGCKYPNEPCDPAMPEARSQHCGADVGYQLEVTATGKVVAAEQLAPTGFLGRPPLDPMFGP